MDFDEALGYMQGRLRLGVKLGNERFLALLERMGNPQNTLRVIHIAGTKGKGSTAAMTASMLQAAGYQVGIYLSPYVYDVRERIQVNGQPISKADFARLVTAIQPHIEALEATEHGPTTEFELKTAVGLAYFAENTLDYTVLEVGLGGRLDATNVIASPLTTVITNIGLDHTELLGNTYAEIAREKAGIVKPGITCVTGVPEGSEAYQTIAAICAERHAPLLRVGPGGETQYSVEANGSLTITTPRRTISDVHLMMEGAFQHANAAVAIAALDSIETSALPLLSGDSVRHGLETAYVPARLEKIAERPTVLLDVAHNELSARVLAQALRDNYQALERRLILVVGLSRHHAPEEFLPRLAELHPVTLIATQPQFRPRDAADIAMTARKLDIADIRVIASSVTDAVREALRIAGPNDLICVTGSFYTVGDVPRSIWTDLLEERTS